jgi:hypothetical protein
MRSLAAFLIGASLLASAAAAQEWTGVVLKATSVKEDDSGNIVVQLVSGATIRVPKADWSKQWSNTLTEAIRSQQAKNAARSSAEPPTDAAAEPMIRTHCAQEWPDDFRMRKHCEDQQKTGLRALRARQATGTLADIRSKCATEWPDDFRMRDYCEKQQIEALQELNR